MGRKLAKIETLSFVDLKAHPEMITDMLASHERTPIFLERSGDTVSVGTAPTYSKATDQLLEEALAEYTDMKRRGYSREDGFAELDAARREFAVRADA